MNSYLLKSEDTSTEGLLVSVPTTSELFTKIIPHESTNPELEEVLVENLRNFHFEQALYCATTEPFLSKKNFDLEYIESESSEEFGRQTISRLKENINVDIPDKIILLDGHHRFSVINKYYINKKNEVPVIFVYFEDLSIGDHYFSSYEEGAYENWFHSANRAGYTEGGDSENYDLVSVSTSSASFNKKYYINSGEKIKNRFVVRDEILSSTDFKFEPSKPPYHLEANAETGSENVNIYFAAKAPTKEELLSGEVFPAKSTWITPKFNPHLYKGYLN
tara:strand:+ start:259 stop:1089 length:831 start_codon:yes stop_codon:yes gene_type:complete